jgi:hypothetical protein
MTTERQLRKMTTDDLEAKNIKLGNDIDEFVAARKVERRAITDELDRRARVGRGAEDPATDTKDGS